MEDNTIINIYLLLQVKDGAQKKKKRSSFVSIQSKKMQKSIKGKKKKGIQMMFQQKDIHVQ